VLWDEAIVRLVVLFIRTKAGPVPAGVGGVAALIYTSEQPIENYRHENEII